MIPETETGEPPPRQLPAGARQRIDPEISASEPSPDQSPVTPEYWTAFGFAPGTAADGENLSSVYCGTLPTGVVAFQAATAEDNPALIALVKPLGAPMLHTSLFGRRWYFFRLAPELQVREAPRLRPVQLAGPNQNSLSDPREPCGQSKRTYYDITN